MQFADIDRVNQLSQEKLSIQAALGMLESGGKISAMTVSGGTYEGPMPGPMPGMPGMTGMPVTVQTQNIDYPPQMTEAIKTALQPRLQQLTEELAQLGVTGMEQAQSQKQEQK